jgi:hypothetical protein
MAYSIHDRTGNLYMDVSPNKSTVYLSLREASEKLKELPKEYFIKDTTTKKKVEPL